MDDEEREIIELLKAGEGQGQGPIGWRTRRLLSRPPPLTGQTVVYGDVAAVKHAGRFHTPKILSRRDAAVAAVHAGRGGAQTDAGTACGAVRVLSVKTHAAVRRQ